MIVYGFTDRIKTNINVINGKIISKDERLDGLLAGDLEDGFYEINCKYNPEKRVAYVFKFDIRKKDVQ